MPWPALAARRRPGRARPVPDLGDPDNPSLELKEGRKQGASSPLFSGRRRLHGHGSVEPSATDSFIEPEPRNARGMDSRQDEAPAEPVSVCAESRGSAETSLWTDEKSVLDRVGVLHSALIDGPSPAPSDLWPQLFSDVSCIALWISSEKILTRLYSVLHWFHKRLEANVKNPRENRCFQTVIVFSFGSSDNSNKCTVLWKIAARLITVSTSVNKEMWVKLRAP